MIRIPIHPSHFITAAVALGLAASCGTAVAQQQEQTPPSVTAPNLQQDPTEPVDRSDAYGQPAPDANQAQPQPPEAAPGAPSDVEQAPPQEGPGTPAPGAPQVYQGQPQPPYGAPDNRPPAQWNTRPPYGVPATLVIQPGTFVNVRLNQALSSDHNQPGDTFSATLTQPVVVNGVVVAGRGQTVYGEVMEAEKAHAGKPSRLRLALTGITLVDGTQMPLASQLISRRGGTTPAGVQAGTVAGTTATGAVIGGAVGWGTGAAIGAGAGAAAGLIGVLLTRDHPTVLYPETALTFQVTTPVSVSTTRAPQAFRYAGPEDYNNPPQLVSRPVRPGPPAGYYPAPYYAYPYAYYPYSYYPYYWGPSVGFYWGPRWHGRWR